MSARERGAAFRRAVEAGKNARLQGKTRDSNPYKQSGAWSLYWPWDIGWCEQDRVESADLPMFLVAVGVLVWVREGRVGRG
jgi:ribosome modulation factor